MKDKKLEADVIAFNLAREVEKQAVTDILALCNALPNGVRKQQVKKPIVKEIFERWGITYE